MSNFSDGLVRREEDLASLEKEYLATKNFINSEDYHKERDRLLTIVCKTILTYNGGNAEFLLGRCYSLVKEVNRPIEIISTYESKKESLHAYKSSVGGARKQKLPIWETL
jgi:hypothetical protein